MEEKDLNYADDDDDKGSLQKKIRDYLGNFSKRRFGNFWVILRCFKGVFRAMVRITKVLGMRRPPPPMLGKIPK